MHYYPDSAAHERGTTGGCCYLLKGNNHSVIADKRLIADKLLTADKHLPVGLVVALLELRVVAQQVAPCPLGEGEAAGVALLQGAHLVCWEGAWVGERDLQ